LLDNPNLIEDLFDLFLTGEREKDYCLLNDPLLVTTGG